MPCRQILKCRTNFLNQHRKLSAKKGENEDQRKGKRERENEEA